MRWPVLATLVLVLGVPALAEAQLFPNLPLRSRPKTPCCNEAPVYGLYRHEYYGYHPTCWRRFPLGWGCPSPEGPQTLAAMEEIRKELENQRAEATGPTDTPSIDGPEPIPARPDQPEGELPPLPPGERSPFELDPGMPPPSGAGASDRTSSLPPALEAAPDASGLLSLPPTSELAEPPIVQPSSPGTSFHDQAAPPLALLDLGAPTAPPTSNGHTVEVLPFASQPAVTAHPGSTFEPMPGALPPSPPIAQAPPRRGGLSGLFQGLNRRRR